MIDVRPSNGRCARLGIPYPRCPSPLRANRVCTLLVYLNDVEAGGETFFNELRLKVAPRQGMGLLFFPCFMHSSKMGAAGRPDPRVAHEGLAVRAGEKYVCQQWGWTGPLLDCTMGFSPGSEASWSQRELATTISGGGESML